MMPVCHRQAHGSLQQKTALLLRNEQRRSFECVQHTGVIVHAIRYNECKPKAAVIGQLGVLDLSLIPILS